MKLEHHCLSEEDLARFQRHIPDGDLGERKLRGSNFLITVNIAFSKRAP